MDYVNLSITNESTVLTDDEVRAILPALAVQVNSHFAPAWNRGVHLSFQQADNKPFPTGFWLLAILDDSDQAGALGYHDFTPDSLPLGKVFAKTTIDAGLAWSVTVSHELLEMLADPNINLAAEADDSAGNIRFFAVEVCDPCEDDQNGYDIQGVKVSDFVLPAWFEPTAQAGPFDYAGLIAAPLQVLPGGYTSELDVTDPSIGWHQVQAEASPQFPNIRSDDRHARRRSRQSNFLQTEGGPEIRTESAGLVETIEQKIEQAIEAPFTDVGAGGVVAAPGPDSTEVVIEQGKHDPPGAPIVEIPHDVEAPKPPE